MVLRALPLTLALSLVALILVRVSFQTGLVTTQIGADQPCPFRPRHTLPTSFHFSPGLEQHRSWISAPAAEPDATDFVLCLDGTLVDTGIGETPTDGTVEVSVRTTWVDVQWALGALELYQVEQRWDIGYTTYTLLNSNGR